MEFKRVNREQRNLELDLDLNGVYVNPTVLKPNQFYQDKGLLELHCKN